MVQAGRNRHRVAIQRATTTKGRFNETVKTWLDGTIVYANVTTVSGRERVEAQQVRPEITHRVFIRWMEDVKEEDRILMDSDALDVEVGMPFGDDDERRAVFGSRVLEIGAVMDLQERRREMELQCKDSKYGV